MGKSKTRPFIDRKTASVYRLVHPTVPGDSEPNESGSHAEQKITPVFQKIRGEVDYFSEEEEEYPYREDSEDEGGDDNEKCQEEGEFNEEEDFEDGENEDDGFDCSESAGGADGSGKKNVWIRSKEETMSEYSSWSSRSASSYLPPARRRQLWRDLEEFGLPDDGYDYTQHLRNAGGGVRIDAKMSADLIAFLDRKKQQAEKSMSKAEKEVVALLYDSDEAKDEGKNKNLNTVDEAEGSSDEDAPPLEDDLNHLSSTARPNAKDQDDRADKLEHGLIVEEGDELSDDFVLQMMGGDDSENWEAGSTASSSRPSRLVDDQFEVMLKKYDDAEVGELPDDHPGLQGRGSLSSYYDILDQYISACKPAPQEGEEEAAAAAAEPQPGIEDDSMDEEERAELVAKTKALALGSHNGEGDSSDDDNDDSDEMEAVAAEEHEHWDCESILSTYSNLYNHPATIRDGRMRVIKLDPRTGAPIVSQPTPAGSNGTHGPAKNTAAAAAAAAAASLGSGSDVEGDVEGGERGSVAQERHVRRKEESKEEKAARKQAAKEGKARALAKKRENKEMVKAAAAKPAGGGAKVNAFDPRARPGVSLRHLD